ncbi:MAG: exosortase [Candidatus Omnitrophica bacterium]|nr:exosortase [Candidatus Omnitrophota bacterium]
MSDKNRRGWQGIWDQYYDAIIAFGLYLVVYIPILVWMWDRWWAADSYYSHGILVPFFSGFLVWQQKETLAKIKRKRVPFGFVLIVIGLLVYLAASSFRIYSISGFSMLIVLAGIILYFFGWAIFKVIWFPFTFLFFMMPLPLFIIRNISFQMKMFAARLSTFILNNIGLIAVQQGSLIKMPHAFVTVDDVCSGLRSLISLTALGSVVAYLMKGHYMKRVILFLSTIPIAIITNMCRIVFLAFVSEVWGAEYVEGAIHDISGYMVFALAFILLMGTGKLLE